MTPLSDPSALHHSNIVLDDDFTLFQIAENVSIQCDNCVLLLPPAPKRYLYLFSILFA